MLLIHFDNQMNNPVITAPITAPIIDSARSSLSSIAKAFFSFLMLLLSTPFNF